jgi:protein-tyrosine-phosphatase
MSPKKKKILIVCTGNTCRSPMAAALMREMLDEEEYDVKSAGLAAIFNMGASVPAIKLMKKEGIDISQHTTTMLSGEMLEEADVVFVMSESHRSGITGWFKNSQDKVHLLREFDKVRDDPFYPDVPDPAGGGIETYKDCLKIIRRSIKKAKKIL